MNNKIKIAFAALLFSLFPASLLNAGLPYAHLKEFAGQEKLYLADKIANNLEIKYCIYINNNETELTKAEFEEQIIAAFNAWTAGIAQYLSQSPRSEEFSDIIEMLQKPIKLKKTSNCYLRQLADYYGYNLFSYDDVIVGKTHQADISFIKYKKFCQTVLEGKDNSFFVNDPFPYICFNRYSNNSSRKGKSYISALDNKVHTVKQPLGEKYEKGDSLYTIIHELGHAIGLADQYEEALDSNDDNYKSIKPGEGIMASGGAPINCDDVNGMITILDRVTNKQRTFKTLCSNSEAVFSNGSEKKELAITPKDKEIFKKKISSSGKVFKPAL